MSKLNKINYIEFPSIDLAKTKIFFSIVFGWEYQDYGPEYVAILNNGIDAGFYKSDLNCSTSNGSVLVVIFSEKLEETELKIKNAGGQIIKEIFEFPGGRRFHFLDITGNEFAVWSDK